MSDGARSADERAGTAPASRPSGSTDAAPDGGRSANGHDREEMETGTGTGAGFGGRLGTIGAAGDRRGSLSLTAQYRDNRLTTAIRAVCFWIAVMLPFLYVPLLVIGVETRAEGLALLALLSLNAVSLLIGHPHRSA